ncbi:MAG: iron uptake system component EfeO [Pseudonocardiales bacterium]|jgi:iron uptake system component EfeO|nr:iron uptake system component EfeO [Pseudonocardiales bacterium]
MSAPARRAITWAAPLAAIALAATACSSTKNRSATTTGTVASTIAVQAGDKTCDVAKTELPAGRHTFEVHNTGAQVTEVYLYAAGDRVLGEVENVGPATKRNLIVELAAGSYQLACKPGMAGDGIRTTLAVSGQAVAAASTDPRLTAAVHSYRDYVEHETAELVDATTDLTAAVKAGDVQRARSLYPTARLHYERIEPIAESFGELDPLIDMRAEDVTAAEPFVGFHRLEQNLYQKNGISKSGSVADALLANTKKLQGVVAKVSITPLTMANGSKSLLDEVAKSKVTGEEERYSRIDLLDFAGNVQGSKYAYTALRPVLAERRPELVATLDKRFSTLLALLDSHRSAPGQKGYVTGSPYVAYNALGQDEIRALAVEVDSISEPLGTISSVVSDT